MITDVLIYMVVHVTAPFLDSFLPSLSLTGFVKTVQTGAQEFGDLLRVVSPVVPVPVLLGWLTVFVVTLPVIAAYVVAQWVWDHIPLIAGFGTG